MLVLIFMIIGLYAGCQFAFGNPWPTLIWVICMAIAVALMAINFDFVQANKALFTIF